MPKMKTHSGAKKRFSATAGGKVQGRAAHKRHRMKGKSKRMKMEGRSTHILHEADGRIILENYLPYERKKLSKKKSRYEGKAKKEAA